MYVFVAGRLECCCGRYLPVYVFVAGCLECCCGRYLPSYPPPFTSVDIYLCMCLLQVVWSVAVGDTFLPTLHPFTSVDI